MSDKIYNMTIPWFEPYTIGILFGSDDPHRAKGALYSQADDPEEILLDVEFINHIKKFEAENDSLKKRKKELAENRNYWMSQYGKLESENALLKEKLKVAIEALNNIGQDDWRYFNIAQEAIAKIQENGK